MTTRTEIEQLLQLSLLRWDSTLDVGSGSEVYRQVISPILSVVGDDPLQSDATAFVRDRLKKEYPLLATEGQGVVDDLLVKPASLILGAMRQQVRRISQRQSVKTASQLTDRDADALMGNWFVSRDPGKRATVYGRLLFSQPATVTVNPSHRWFTGDGLNFATPMTQTVTSQEMMANRSGELYYADFFLQAELAGDSYSIEAGELQGIVGITNAVRVTNPGKATIGAAKESTNQLIARGRRSLVERSTTNARGIYARLTGAYSDIRSLEVVGYNDPEMLRDIITGAGEGHLHTAGRAFVFGTYVLYFSVYEDRGPAEDIFVEPGYGLDLVYGKMLYSLNSEDRKEHFDILDIVFDSRATVPKLPNILLLRIDRVPEPTTTALGGLPGFLPFVGGAITRPGKITISNIPGGIQAPTTEHGTVEINDGEIHIGGHHDVWLRPMAVSEGSFLLTQVDDEAPFMVRDTLSTQGTSGTPNIVISSDATLDWEQLGVRAGMYLWLMAGADVGVYRILDVASTYLVLDADMSATETGLLFKVVSDILVDLVQPKRYRVPMGSLATGASLSTTIGSAILSVDTNLLALGTRVGDVVEILEGDDRGTYAIKGFDSSGGGTTPVVDRSMSHSAAGLNYSVYGADNGVQLPLVRIQPGGVKLVDSAGQSTDITVPYALPVEARLLDSVRGVKERARGTVGFTLPGLGEAFAVAESACPANIDAAIALQTGDFANATPAEVQAAFQALVGRAGQYSDDCLNCDDGYIFCVTIDKETLFLNYDLPPDGRALVNNVMQWITDILAAFFPSFISASPPILEAIAGGIQVSWNKGATVTNELSDTLHQFEICVPAELIGCCSNLFLALPDVDLKRFIGAISDFITAVNAADAAAETAALADIRQQLPRFGPGLAKAQVGDTLVVDRGPNAGSYVISSHYTVSLNTTIAGSGYGLAVLNAVMSGKDYFWLFRLLYSLIAKEGDAGWVPADDLQLFDNDPAVIKLLTDVLDSGLDTFIPILQMAAVGIEGSFPVNSWEAICNAFDVGWPTLPALPAAPSFVLDCYDNLGTPADPFDIVVEFVKWFLEFLEVLGLDVDTDFDLAASDIFATVLDGVRTSYKVGTPSCELWARTYFTEPTTFEATGGSKCQLSWDPTTNPATPRILPYEKPSLFVGTSGAQELLFAADVNADPFQVLPHKNTGSEAPDPRKFPRDMTATAIAPVGTHAFADIKLTDLSRPAPIALGIEKYRDRIEIHPEVLLLPVGGPADTVHEFAFLTQRNSNVLTVPDLFYNVSDPLTDLRNRLEVGDLLFLEEGLGKGGYRITAIPNATQVQVDRAMVETTLPILKQGVTGAWDGTLADPEFRKLTVSAAPFDSNDVGRWLTIWGSAYPAANGSYAILEVDTGSGLWVLLDIPAQQFPAGETDTAARWMITRAPSIVPSTATAGGTELLSVRPARIYQGVPVSVPIVDVDSSLDATAATSTFTVETTDVSAAQAFLDSTRQPFRILRDGIQRISSTQMAKNREGGLFYFDVKIRALGVGDEYQVPERTRLEPVFGTYKSDGYLYVVEDPNFTFSPEEKVRLQFSNGFLPVGRKDELARRVPLLGQSLQIGFEYAPLVSQVHQFLLSKPERTVCANPLARHYLPSFVYLDLTYEGGAVTASEMAQAIRTAIESLDPEEALSLAREVETVLRSQGATDWAHDIWISIVTHDRRRRLVGNRSRDRLGGDEAHYFDGSNRVSFFVPGPVRSPDLRTGKYLTEDDIPMGERIRTIQKTRVRGLI